MCVRVKYKQESFPESDSKQILEESMLCSTSQVVWNVTCSFVAWKEFLRWTVIANASIKMQCFSPIALDWIVLPSP